ncbi:hypothetical protein TSAR_003667 [Trichomalopsis sarcophagae]|uniref:N-acetyltransferase domain-containing protein n=1 Tax=Trichomalopsis sarcophagae TaxID=543379 RepID=A0A232F7T1_9HYME|nr:hypothetical protein TSAR_003667 [Trichomalopsis sarcophagae]
MLPKDYEIRDLKDQDRPLLLGFIMQHFYLKEYLLKTYFAKNEDQITEKDWRTIKEDFETRHKSLVASSSGLIAVHLETQQIAGVLMYSIADNPNSTSTIDCKSPNDTRKDPPKSKLLSDFFDLVLRVANSSVDIFQRFPEFKTAMKLNIVCVDSTHQSRGLFKALVHSAVTLARDRKAPVVCGLFTSSFTHAALEKQGFEYLKKMNMMSFRDLQGNAIYEGTSKPCEIATMALVL